MNIIKLNNGFVFDNETIDVNKIGILLVDNPKKYNYIMGTNDIPKYANYSFKEGKFLHFNTLTPNEKQSIVNWAKQKEFMKQGYNYHLSIPTKYGYTKVIKDDYNEIYEIGKKYYPIDELEVMIKEKEDIVSTKKLRSYNFGMFDLTNIEKVAYLYFLSTNELDGIWFAKKINNVELNFGFIFPTKVVDWAMMPNFIPSLHIDMAKNQEQFLQLNYQLNYQRLSLLSSLNSSYRIDKLTLYEAVQDSIHYIIGLNQLYITDGIGVKKILLFKDEDYIREIKYLRSIGLHEFSEILIQQFNIKK